MQTLKRNIAHAVLATLEGGCETLASLIRFVPANSGAEPLFQLRHIILSDRKFVVSTAQEIVTLNMEALAEGGKVVLADAAQLAFRPNASSRAYLKHALARHIIDSQTLPPGFDDTVLFAVSADTAGRYYSC